LGGNVLNKSYLDKPVIVPAETDPLSLHLAAPNQTVTQKPQFNAGVVIKENQWVYLDGV
jgi:hypothetical protein